MQRYSLVPIPGNTYLKVFSCSSLQFLLTRMRYECISTWSPYDFSL